MQNLITGVGFFSAVRSRALGSRQSAHMCARKCPTGGPHRNYKLRRWPFMLKLLALGLLIKRTCVRFCSVLFSLRIALKKTNFRSSSSSSHIFYDQLKSKKFLWNNFAKPYYRSWFFLCSSFSGSGV